MPRRWTVRQLTFGVLLLILLLVIGRVALPLGPTTAIVVGLSVVNGALFGLVRGNVVRSLGIVLVPFLLAYSLYWLPVWLGSDSSEYSSWALLGVSILFAAGVFPSAIAGVAVRKVRDTRARRGSTA